MTRTAKLPLANSPADQVRPQVSVELPRNEVAKLAVRLCDFCVVHVPPLFHESATPIAQPLPSVERASTRTWMPAIVEPLGIEYPKVP